MRGTPAVPLRDRGLRSSWETPFAVVSSLQLVDGIGAPGAGELDVLMGEVMNYIAALEEEEAVVIAGFEGEMVGHGGELVTATFLPTGAVDKDTLKQLPLPPGGKPEVPGLLMDLRCAPGVEVLKRVMESERVTKLVWDASSEFQSLMHQDSPMLLDVRPQRVVDVQLAFGNPNLRVGMFGMLGYVPASYVKGLPSQEQTDLDAAYSRNRRAMALPLRRVDAVNAVDDLHRIEAILRSIAPPDGSYLQASDLTGSVLREVREDPLGLQSLRREMELFPRTRSVDRRRKAVQIKRRILAVRARGGQVPRGSLFRRTERHVDKVLELAGVTVPEDLSFW